MMDRLHTLLEGLALALLGGAMCAFSLSEFYWMLLSPKFQPLTAAAGFVLFVVGAAMVTRKPPQGSRRWGALATLTAFLCMAGWAILGPDTSFAPEPPQRHASLDMELPEPAEDFESRLVLDGREYVRISVPELFALTQGDKPYPEAVAMRGMVARSQDLDRKNMIAVFRIHVFCCLADAVAPGFLVSVDNPNDFPQGTWVRVAGEVKESASDNTNGDIALPGMLMSFLCPKHEIRSHVVEKIEPPDIPFTFEVRDREPFVY